MPPKRSDHTAIYDAAGDKAKSHSYVKAALAINPQFHIFYADQARELLNSVTVNAANLEGSE